MDMYEKKNKRVKSRKVKGKIFIGGEGISFWKNGWGE